MKASLKALPFLLMFLALPLTAAHAQGPSLSPIANVTLNAGGTLNLNVIAIDPEERLINLTAALPPFVTLNTPTIGTGMVVTSLTLAPSAAHVGDYSAAVTATAGGISTVRVFQITVNAAGSDQPPVVLAPALQEVTAGTALSFAVTAGDADGDAITSLSASGLPTGASFTPGGSNTTGTFDWMPGNDDVGDYDVQFTAANALSGTNVTHVHVTSAPTLMITPIDDVTVAGGGFLSVPVHASGVPDALITLTASLPTFATLDPPGSGTGAVNTTVTIAPPNGSAGTYHASITATSLGTNVTEEFDIIVTGEGAGDNHAPVLTAPATATIEVGSTLSFDVSASDPDGDHVDLYGTALPPGSDFTDHADDTGTFTWTPVSGQAGTYQASFSGLDGRGGSGSASTMITVTDGANENHPPTVIAPAEEEVQVGVNLTFMVTATDPDGDHVTLSANALPFGASFSDNGDNTGTFSWTPGSDQAGPYEVAFLGFDGMGGTGTASTAITVMEATPENHPPTLSAPANAQVDEGSALTFAVTASDPDGDHVTLSAGALPDGASFSDHGDNTGTFAWTPGSDQSGPYAVAFLGDDGHGGTGNATTNIVVVDVAPVGDGEVPGKACLLGKFDPQSEQSCFRIRPVDHSFDLRDVVLTSIRLRFHGETIPALDGAEITLECHSGHGYGSAGLEGNDHGDDDDQGDDNDHADCGDDHGGDDCGVSCDDDRGNDHPDWEDCRGGVKVNGSRQPIEYCAPHGIITHICIKAGPTTYSVDADGTVGGCYEVKGIGTSCVAVTGGGHGATCKHIAQVHFFAEPRPGDGTCDTLGIRACFSTDALIRLFTGAAAVAGNDSHEGAGLPCALVDAEILATLADGATVVATFNGSGDHKDQGDDDDEHGDDGKDKDKDGDKGNGNGNGNGDGNGNGNGNDDLSGNGTGSFEEIVSARLTPNPVNPNTELSFTVPHEGRVRVVVYDMQGRLVTTLLDEFRPAGRQTLPWNGTDAWGLRVASGVYFLRVQMPEGGVTRRVTVVK